MYVIFAVLYFLHSERRVSGKARRPQCVFKKKENGLNVFSLRVFQDHIFIQMPPDIVGVFAVLEQVPGSGSVCP